MLLRGHRGRAKLWAPMASFDNNHITLIVLPLTHKAVAAIRVNATPIMPNAKSFTNISLSFASPAGLCAIGTPHLPCKFIGLSWIQDRGLICSSKSSFMPLSRSTGLTLWMWLQIEAYSRKLQNCHKAGFAN